MTRQDGRHSSTMMRETIGRARRTALLTTRSSNILRPLLRRNSRSLSRQMKKWVCSSMYRTSDRFSIPYSRAKAARSLSRSCSRIITGTGGFSSSLSFNPVRRGLASRCKSGIVVSLAMDGAAPVPAKVGTGFFLPVCIIPLRHYRIESMRKPRPPRFVIPSLIFRDVRESGGTIFAACLASGLESSDVYRWRKTRDRWRTPRTPAAKATYAAKARVVVAMGGSPPADREPGRHGGTGSGGDRPRQRPRGAFGAGGDWERRR